MYSHLRDGTLDVSLHADEPLRAGLLRVADGLIQNALDRIRYPTSDRGEDVHLVRVTIKRLRAMLRLVRPVISKAVFDREYLRLKKGSTPSLVGARHRCCPTNTGIAAGFERPRTGCSGWYCSLVLTVMASHKLRSARRRTGPSWIWNRRDGTFTGCGSLDANGRRSSRD